MKKMIGIDLDGTLLTTNKTITDFTKQTLSEVTKYNNKVVIATGRSYIGAIKYYEQLKLKTPLITLNGAQITLPDGTEILKPIPKKEVTKIYNDLNKMIVTGFLNCSKMMFTINHSLELEKLFNGEVRDDTTEYDEKLVNKADVLNMVILINDKDRAEFEAYFDNTKLVHRHWGSHNGESFYDIFLDGVSKASALKEVLSMYNLSKEDLITFGDGHNDIEMLQYANDGIAMKNAHPDVLETTKYSTDRDNDNDGVANYLITYYL